MASTNKTTHYELSQYVGTDKPTYLVDYNTDMATIDTGIYDAQSTATENATNIGTLSNLTTSNKADLVDAVNEVNGVATTNASHIGNLSNLTTEANTSLVAAINEVDGEADTNNQNIGTMTNLETTVKSSLVGAINEVNDKVGVLNAYSTTQDKSYSANYINTLNNYSTSETVCGTWIDGKPLYRKVISNTLPNATTDGNNVSKEITIADNIDNAFFDKGYFITSSGNHTPLPFNQESSGIAIKVNLTIKNSNKKIVLNNNYTSFNGDTAIIVILYTKTTD